MIHDSACVVSISQRLRIYECNRDLCHFGKSFKRYESIELYWMYQRIRDNQEPSELIVKRNTTMVKLKLFTCYVKQL